MYVKRNIETRSHNHFCHGKEVLHVMSVCVCVGLIILHAKRVRRIVLLSVACPALSYYSTLSYKRYDFRKNVIVHKTCFGFFQLI